ncbi:TPA: trigger factor [Streptococcus pneumoniae]
MSVSFENKETNRGVLTFTISQDQIKPELDRVFKSVKKSLNVPGFRKGHLPRPIFDKKFGEESLYQDVMNALLPNAYEAAVKEAGLEVVAQPKIDVTSMEKGQDWVIAAEVVTKPEVKLGDYKNLEVSVDVEKEVTDADVEERIERERNNLAELVIKEAAAENGDTVVIDFVGSIDGVEFDGGKGENFSLGLGSGQFIPGFEDQLVGHSAGETVDVIVTFPEDYQAEDYQAEDLAGKEAKFVTTIHEVKAKEVPALDDELAKDIDEEVETLADLKEKYRKELAAAKEEAYKDAVEGAAIDTAVENAEIVELPEEMIHEEVHRSVNEFLGNLQRQGINPDMYFQITGTTQEDLHNQYQAEAESRTKTNLVIEAVAKAEGFDASEEEIQKEVEQLAADYNMEVAQVQSLLSADMLKHDITIKKAVELITSTATVK